MNIILASTSPARKKIFSQLQIPFQCAAPNCDESPLTGETAIALVQRLAKTKALSLTTNYTDSIIISADQVCEVEGEIKGKPHNFTNAKKQLLTCSGKKITFYTGLAIVNSNTLKTQVCYESFNVYFRHLTETEVESYLKKEQPYSCAGAFKCDGLGILLFERLEGDDLHTLIGLPLILLNKILISWGINLLSF